MSYWNSVEAMADEVFNEFGKADQDAISERVQWSNWIISYGRNEEVLENTHNTPEVDEVTSSLAPGAPGAGWKEQRQLAACIAMERDVNEKIAELEKAHEGQIGPPSEAVDLEFLIGLQIHSNEWVNVDDLRTFLAETIQDFLNSDKFKEEIDKKLCENDSFGAVEVESKDFEMEASVEEN